MNLIRHGWVMHLRAIMYAIYTRCSVPILLWVTKKVYWSWCCLPLPFNLFRLIWEVETWYRNLDGKICKSLKGLVLGWHNKKLFVIAPSSPELVWAATAAILYDLKILYWHLLTEKPCSTALSSFRQLNCCHFISGNHLQRFKENKTGLNLSHIITS